MATALNPNFTLDACRPRRFKLSEGQVNDLRLEFDYLVSHGETKAQSFDNWMRRRGNRKAEDGSWWSRW